MLDVVSDTAVLGKTQGADDARNKPTYVRLLGLEAAQRKAQDLIAEAIAALAPIRGDTSHLIALANFITSRQH